jgi:ABC-type Fe3+ transport system permease subunit/sugar lactone lactonase YvrE
MNWDLLQNSVLIGSLATGLALLFGFAVALSGVTLGGRSRLLVLGAGAVALMLPPFLVTNTWLHLLGQTGVLRPWLPVDIYSRAGTVWILALLTWPVTMFLLLAEWNRIESAQLESEPALRGWALIRWVLLPAARPGFALAALLTFVLAFNNFAVPAILQTKVFPAELWVSFNTTFDYRAALGLSWPLLAVPLAVLCLLQRRPIAWPRWNGGPSPRLFRRSLGAGWTRLAAVVCAVVFCLSVLLPLSSLALASRTWIEFPSAFAAGQSAFWNSLRFAVLATLLAMLLAMVLWRFRFGRLLWIAFLVPGILLGLGIIYSLNRPSLNWLYPGAGVVVAGLALRYAAIGWTGIGQAMRQVDPDLRDAARLSGASRWQIFRHVCWPEIAPQAAAAAYLTYLFCLWDVETLVFIVPPAGETMSLRVFNLLHYGHNSQVNALCLMLLLLAILPLALWHGARRLGAVRWRGAALAFSLAVAPILILTGCSPSGTDELKSEIFSHVEIIGSRGTGLGFFNKPRSVAVDAADNVYVVDMTGRVQKFSPNGVYLSSWQMPQTEKGKPKGMCRDHEGNIVVIEPHYSRINHFSQDGELLSQWGVHGTNRGQIIFPRSAVTDSQGNIFIGEYGVLERVQKFSPRGGALLLQIGHAGTGPGTFNRPEGLGMDLADILYVADSCNHRIQVFEADGTFLRTYGRAGTGPGELSYPYDVQVDRDGNQFVCEFGNSRVQVFNRQGHSIEIIGRLGSEPGQFSNPWSLAFDSAGNLYVADSQNHRVQKFIRRKPYVASRAAPASSRTEKNELL